MIYESAAPTTPVDSVNATRRMALTIGGLGAAGVTLGACGSEAKAGTTLAAADVPVGGGTILGDAKVVVTQPTAGAFKAFSAVCTHQACLLTGVSTTLDCACHGSKFSLSDGSVVNGPATSALPAMTVAVEGDTLRIS